MDLNYIRTQVKMAKYGFHYVRSWTPQRTKYIFIMSGHKSKSQKMDLIYVRTQVKIAKDGFDLYPDTSQNRKIWQLNLMEKCVLYDRGSIQIKKN